MQALLDIGNTRIKWALLDDTSILPAASVEHRDELDAAIEKLAAALPDAVDRLVVANVAGERVNDALRARFADRVAIEVVEPTAVRFGVRCAYAEPGRLGVDRWIATIAAYHAAAGRAACVIDAGTAVTFDAVDAGGQHLGGLILPGARLQAAALDRNTSRIGETSLAGPRPQGLSVLGSTTDAAVGHGTMLALAAGLDRAVSAVARELGTMPVVYLTGGDAIRLQSWLETPVQLRADLVLEGLALFAAEPQVPSKETDA